MKKEVLVSVLADMYKCEATQAVIANRINLTQQAISAWPDNLTARHLRMVAGGIVQSGRRIPRSILAELRKGA